MWARKKETGETEADWSAALQHPGVIVHNLPEVLQPRKRHKLPLLLPFACLSVLFWQNVIAGLPRNQLKGP